MSNPRSTVQIAGHPIHVMIVPFVIGFYVGAFAADLAYMRAPAIRFGRAAPSGCSPPVS